ncbi:MAG: DUF2163 domain-containing protein, partial [Oxalobacteraceae bacterium]
VFPIHHSHCHLRAVKAPGGQVSGGNGIVGQGPIHFRAVCLQPGVAADGSGQHSGRFDGAQVAVGVVDWENMDHAVLYRGEVGAVSEEAGGFSAELRSAKAVLELDPIPRTSPTCRAQFCGPGCGLSAARFTHEARLSSLDPDSNRVTFTGAPAAAALLNGSLRWIDGPQAGIAMQVIDADADGLLLDIALDLDTPPGTRALLRGGCDHTLATCATLFGNAANFRGEPFLPGNDLLARYPTSAT